jgi:hypothetical protein
MVGQFLLQCGINMVYDSSLILQWGMPWNISLIQYKVACHLDSSWKGTITLEQKTLEILHTSHFSPW